MAQSDSVCFPFTEPGLCMNTRFFSAHTQNRQRVDREEILAEFDKKCIRLEWQTTPLSTIFTLLNVECQSTRYRCRTTYCKFTYFTHRQMFSEGFVPLSRDPGFFQ